jgi:hypothetical protein
MTKYDLDIKKKKKYAILTLKWCQEYFGINERKRTKLNFVLSEKTRNIKGKFLVYGRYCFSKNKMVIYLPNCKTIDLLVSTIIHEYTHYLQSGTMYRKYEKTHYYSTNPFERCALRNEEKYTKMCIKNIKKLI